MLDIDLGDLFSWGAEVVTFVANVFDEAINGIAYAINVMIDGINYVVNTVIQFAEQCLDVVEMIFNAAKVKFKQLMGWLGFIFNWGDIVRTHKVIAYTMTQIIDFVPAVVGLMKEKGDSYLDTAKDKIHAGFQALIAHLGGSTINQMAGAMSAPPSTNSDAMTHDLLLRGANHGPSASSSALVTTAQQDSAQQTLLSTLQGFADSFTGSEAFQNAMQYFQAAFHGGQGLDGFLKSTLLGTLNLLEAICTTAIDIVKTIFNAIMDALIGVLNTIGDMATASWDIPFVSDLYEKMAGNPPSLVDIVALILAVPATIMYKAIEAEPPYKDDASVTAATSQFTAASMVQKLKDATSASATISVTKRDQDTSTNSSSLDLTTEQKVLAYIYGITNVIGGPLAAWGDFIEYGKNWPMSGTCQVRASSPGSPARSPRRWWPASTSHSRPPHSPAGSHSSRSSPISPPRATTMTTPST